MVFTSLFSMTAPAPPWGLVLQVFVIKVNEVLDLRIQKSKPEDLEHKPKYQIWRNTWNHETTFPQERPEENLIPSRGEDKEGRDKNH